MFITFEGGDGTGKTTLIERIALRLAKHRQVLVTREPGGSEISEKIRAIILDKNHTRMTYQTEALLYAASRTQHLDEVIKPALRLGNVVLCDRYIDSSIAYQGYGRDLGYDYVYGINGYAAKTLPDLTFYIDVDPHIGMSRIKGRTQLDRLDLETIEFHQKVRKGYLEVLVNNPNRVILIAGDQSIDMIEETIYSIIKERLL